MVEPEAQARQNIDKLLEAAGWTIQNKNEINLSASLGIAVREFQLGKDAADYLLFVDGKPVGVVEAKKEGVTLSGVAEQSEKYLELMTKIIPTIEKDPPFHYESTGIETNFRDKRDPDSRSRRVFAFHKPKTLKEWFENDTTLRARLREMPQLNEDGLWKCQIKAITNLEKSFKNSKPRALIQMATGSGKTFTAVNFVYRLLKFAKAKRVLFLVDRNNLATQTYKEFCNFKPLDDGRNFNDIYGVHPLKSKIISPSDKVCISTIQRVYSILKNEEIADEEIEEKSLFESELDEEPLEVTYNPNIPIEEFDIIITDECHRSIYNKWRQVLEYFDGFIIGLTATPSLQTFGFFNQNLVTEYDFVSSVADNVNVGYDVYRISTQITQEGSKVPPGFYIDKRSRLNRKKRWEQLDEMLDYQKERLDRDVVAPDQIRTVIKTFKEKLFTEIFPGRTEVPKTLIFAKDDNHAEDIVEAIREEFGKGNDFCKKITYRSEEKSDTLIRGFTTSRNPRIAVTVDMIATGTDIKPIECLLFMRDVKTRTYFEQMKGRGCRTISKSDFQLVTPDADEKTHFVIVDAVGVCETDKTDSRPLERKRTVPFDKLLDSIALGVRDEDTLSSLADRLVRLNRKIDESNRKEIESVAGKSINQLTSDLIHAIDPDSQEEKAKILFNTKEPTEEQIKKATEVLVKTACEPFAFNPKLRSILNDIKSKNEQIIDIVSKDTLISAGFEGNPEEYSKKTINNFKKFIEDNKDQITALQIIYNMPYSKKYPTYEEIKQLAEAIQKPPYGLTPEIIWNAYETLEKSKVRGAGPKTLLTNIITLIRFAIGKAVILESFSETVERNFEKWLINSEKSGVKFTNEQKEWLVMIKEFVASSLTISINDLQLPSFYDKGGAAKAQMIFGDRLNDILNELNEALVAV